VNSQPQKKTAALSWGGGQYHLGPTNGVGLEAGYDYGLGVLPLPRIGARFGTDKGGISIGGPIPYIGLDTGRRKGWTGNNLRSLWKYIADRQRPSEEVLEEELAALKDPTWQQVQDTAADRGILLPNLEDVEAEEVEEGAVKPQAKAKKVAAATLLKLAVLRLSSRSSKH
jgi:hypothetical protein